MTKQLLPPDVMRFLLTSIPSVPHLEAILLLRQKSNLPWDSKELARRLYISDKKAGVLLCELLEVGILVYSDLALSTYRFSPISDELRHRIDQLAEIYTKNIVEVTNLIHSKSGNQIQQFADAFKLRKDS